MLIKKCVNVLKVSGSLTFLKMCFIAITVVLSCCCCVDAHAVVNITDASGHWQSRTSSILIALTTVKNTSSVSSVCHRQLQRLQRDARRKQPWAMMAIDASATKSAGFMFGDNFWLGSRDICSAINHPLDISLTGQQVLRASAPFAVDYRVVYLRHNSSWQISFPLTFHTPLIHVGLCVPSACDAPELASLMSSYLATAAFAAQDIYEMRPRVVYAKSLQLRAAFYERRSFSIMSAILLFTLAMTICASMLQLEARTPPISAQRVVTNDEMFMPNANSVQVQKVEASFCYALKSFIKCFDIRSNCAKLFSLTATTDFGLIDGLRTLAAFATACFHVLHFMEATVSNKIALYMYTERAGNLVVFVEAFYVISGFLRTYNFMRNHKRMELIRVSNLRDNCKEYLKMVLHRLLRFAGSRAILETLSPLYLVAICASDLLFAYLDDVSIFHLSYRLHDNCARYWWRNLLYIHNSFDYKDICLIWTWSLATEVQYFLLATLLLFLFARHPKYAQRTVLLLLAANMLWTYRISIDCQMSLASVTNHFTQVYTNSTVRVLPYILGAMAAWWQLQSGNCAPSQLSAIKQHCLWLCAAAVIVTGVCAPLPDLVPAALVALIIVFGRLLFALSVSWLIVGSKMLPGRCWSLPFEAKVFRHLSRACYAISLFHPLVIMWCFYLGNSSTHVQPFQLCIWIVGLAFAMYLVALVSSLLFELPYNNWSNFLLQPDKRKTA